MPNLLRIVIAGAFCFLFQSCGGGGGSGSETAAAVPPPPVPDPDPVFQYALIADVAMPVNPCMAPLFAPADLGVPIYATTVDLASHQNDTGFVGDQAPMAAYPRHLTDGGPTLVLDSGEELTDDIRLLIGTNAAGQYVSVQIKGQPIIGADSLSHESDIVQFAQSVDPIETQTFVAHVDSTQPIPMWQLDDHLGGNRVAVVGNFCLGDMKITPIALVGATPSQNELQKFTASDGAGGDEFGGRLVLDGDSALIGARLADDNGDNSGSAYIFNRDAGGVWTEQQKLIASDVAAGDAFGAAIALDGDTALIGAQTNDENGSNAGAAYIFIRGAGGVWTEQQKLMASDGAVEDFFAETLALENDTAMIAAYFDDDNGAVSGSAYVFIRGGGGIWTEQQKLTPNDGGAGDFFGVSPALDGDTVVFGAPGGNNGAGAAYVFTRDAGGVWTEQQKLVANDGDVDDVFGDTVTLSGDTAIIGAVWDDDKGRNAGAAYVFSRSAGVWNLEQKLTASDGAASDEFGASVAMDGDTVVIAAGKDDDNGADSGSAYIFARDAAGIWTERLKITASDGTAGDLFSAPALNAGTILIGARRDDDNGPESGSVYVFGL